MECLGLTDAVEVLDVSLDTVATRQMPHSDMLGVEVGALSE